MREFITFYLPWLMSAWTIALNLLAGNKVPWAWTFGLASQALWSLWILASGQWGFLPMNIMLWVVYYRNHRLWMRGYEEREVWIKATTPGRGNAD